MLPIHMPALALEPVACLLAVFLLSFVAAAYLLYTTAAAGSNYTGLTVKLLAPQLQYLNLIPDSHLPTNMQNPKFVLTAGGR